MGSVFGIRTMILLAHPCFVNSLLFVRVPARFGSKVFVAGIHELEPRRMASLLLLLATAGKRSHDVIRRKPVSRCQLVSCHVLIFWIGHEDA